MITARTLRPLLVALTNALETRDPFAETILVDLPGGAVVIDSKLDDIDVRPARVGREVPLPDGLWEWRVRRDFVRSLPRSVAKTRLSATLGGPKTRRRFEVSLAGAGPELQSAFRRHRRRRLRGYAARVLRWSLAA